MTGERLTRNELTWLLAQEARGAAQKLRRGVGMTAELDALLPPPVDEGSAGVETTLNRLDEAVTMLASLHGHAVSRGRRGKVDLAALLWEVAPEARVEIKMGAGTTAFGDEAELRRMLQVFTGQGGDPTSARGSGGVFIHREGDEIRLRVSLGPDKSATFDTEHAWLSRMATRYGGRLELDGSTQTLILPADVDSNRRELETLQKELAAAQAQGEAYARELAAVSVGRAPPVEWSSYEPGTGDPLAVLVAGVRALGADLRGILAAIGRDIVPLRDLAGVPGEIAGSVNRHVTAASEIVADLALLGSCPLGELPRQSNLAELLREVVASDLVRAARHEIRVVLDAPDHVEEAVSAGALSALFHVLLDHAINASPAGSQVFVTLVEASSSVTVTFDDAGPSLPASARAGLLSRDFEVVSLGRTAGLALIAAFAIAAHLRVVLDLDDAPRGGMRMRVVLPRA